MSIFTQSGKSVTNEPIDFAKPQAEWRDLPLPTDGDNEMMIGFDLGPDYAKLTNTELADWLRKAKVSTSLTQDQHATLCVIADRLEGSGSLARGERAPMEPWKHDVQLAQLIDMACIQGAEQDSPNLRGRQARYAFDESHLLAMLRRVVEVAGAARGEAPQKQADREDIRKILREIIGKGAHDHYFSPDEVEGYVARFCQASDSGSRGEAPTEEHK